ncbi:N-acetylmuramoyl-L-alanine amidase [Streptomyces sp. NPDC126497]|uniref:peptidoglycan recognition protein family protein n=1 Tax=Streptomyces sp. NPDC126497 TaxID=3155313 RepID=UPI003321F218
MTPDTWIRVLKAEGVKVSEYPGWRTRSRDSATGLAFGPVRMILNHHTAGRNSRDIVAKNGVPGLPAPLAHVHLAKNGTATMCSAGRANHAGPMAVNAYRAFRDELSAHPAPARSSGTIDGNDVSYGVETENLGDGEDVYPREQYDAWVRICAAVCRHHGWSMDSVGCHKETSVEGKVDPRGPVEGYGSRGRFSFTPEQFRRDVNERLKHPASWSPGTPARTPRTEDDMALSDADIAKVADAVVDRLLSADRFDAPEDAADYSDDPKSRAHYWSGRTVFRDLVTRVRRIDGALAKLAAKES